MMTTVKFDGGEYTYNLPPEEALVCAYEALVRKNWMSWTYGWPEQYPIKDEGKCLRLGPCIVEKEACHDVSV